MGSVWPSIEIPDVNQNGTTILVPVKFNQNGFFVSVLIWKKRNLYIKNSDHNGMITWFVFLLLLKFMLIVTNTYLISNVGVPTKITVNIQWNVTRYQVKGKSAPGQAKTEQGFKMLVYSWICIQVPDIRISIISPSSCFKNSMSMEKMHVYNNCTVWSFMK